MKRHLEAGARNSAADLAKIQAIHDHTAALGADCSKHDLPPGDSAEESARGSLSELLLGMFSEKGARNSKADKERIQAVHDATYDLGAKCGPPDASLPGNQDEVDNRIGAAAEALREAGVLRMDDTHDARRQALQQALTVKHIQPGQYNSYGDYPSVHDVFDDQVVYRHGDKLKAAPYTMDKDGKPQVGDAEEVVRAYVPADKDGDPKKEAFRQAVAEAGILRHDDSIDHKTDIVRKALVGKYSDGYGFGGCPSVWLRDLFDKQVVYHIGGQCYSCDYSIDGDTVTLGDPTKVVVAYVPEEEEASEALRVTLRAATGVFFEKKKNADNECPECDGTGKCPECEGTGEDGDEECEECGGTGKCPECDGTGELDESARRVRSRRLARLLERTLSKKERDKIPDEDFAGKDRSFFIQTPEDVHNAAQSIGRAGADNFDTATLKANIITIAKRKGADYEAQLPDEWKSKSKESAAAGAAGLISLNESAHIDCTGLEMIPLKEAAIREGKIQVRVITPGWGSSGYYSEEVLKRDGPSAFPAFTPMFWNHATAEEEAARPEGNLDNLAAVLLTPATWDGNHPKGPGLYSEAKVFSDHASQIDEKAPFIGVSIRALGRAKTGTIEGRTGPIVESLTIGKSTDFVTKAGRGGAVLTESQKPLFEFYESFRASGSAAEGRNTNQGESMTPQEQQEMQALREAATTNATESAALKTELARLKERNLLSDAASFIATEFATPGKAGHALPDITKTRLTESLSKNPPVNQSGELDRVALAATVEATAKSEAEYLAQATGSGQIRNLGSAQTTEATPMTEAELNTQLAEEFTRFGMTGDQAKTAASGRTR